MDVIVILELRINNQNVHVVIKFFVYSKSHKIKANGIQREFR